MYKIASVLKNGFLMAVLFLVVSCSMLNEPVKDFFKEYTETAAIEVERLPESVVVDSRKLNCFSSENDLEITYLLRNPQKYSLDFEYEFNENLTEVPTYDELKFSQSDDKNSVMLTISKSYLNRIDKDNIFDKDISGHIKIIESNSGREFKSYQTRLSANTVPPEINDVNVMILKEDDEKQTYVLCFNFPKLTGTVHENDVVEMLITIPEKSDGGFIEREMPVALYDGVISDSDISTSKPAGDLVPSSGGEFVASADSSYIAYYYKTGLELTQDNLIYTLKLKDLYGLSSESVIGNHSPKLNAPFIIDASGNSVADDASHTFVVDEDTGVASIFIGESGKASYYNTEGSVEKEIDVTGATLNWKVYDSSSGSPVVYSSGKNTGSVELKLPKGKYTIEVSQSKPYYISSETVMTKNDGIVMKVAPNYYVSSSGSDTEGLGSRQKPYATIQNAISEINSNTDIDDDTQAYIRLMSNIQVSDTIEFSDETLQSGRAKNIIMEPYGISNATISLGGLKDRKLLDAKLTAAGANLTLNNLTLENGSTEDHVANVGMISSSMKLVMNNITIQNSSNSNAALLQFNGDTEMNGCTIRNCYSSSRLFAIGHHFTLTNSSITNNKAWDIVDNEGTLTVSNCVITDNTVTGSAASYDSAFRVSNSNTLKLAGKLIVKNNKYTDGKPANLLFRSTVKIEIESDLTGSDIHISYARPTQPSYGNPSIFTSGYSSFNTANPGTFFTSDDGYIAGLDDSRTEAALYVSADSPSIQIDEDIEITSPTTVVALGTASRSVTFKVLNKSTGEDVTSKADLKLTPKYLNTVLPSDYYSVSGSTVTFADTIEPGLYTIAVEATVNGAKYSANHNVEVKKAGLMTLSQYEEVPEDGSTVYISSQDDITKLKDLFKSNSVYSASVCDTLNCIVTNDITLTNFIHIGYGGIKDVFYHFRGTFDGNGHTITVKDSPQFDGLFNTVRKDTTIKNLTMAGTIDGETAQYKAAFIKSLDYSGASVDAYTGNVVIENCVNKMNIQNKEPGMYPAGRNNAAGFVTRSNVKLTIKNCRNEGNISAETDAAGFINYWSNTDIKIINCVNTGNISINEGSATNRGYAAGICNEFSQTSIYIMSCINRGKITGSKSGGLVSKLTNGAAVHNSINYGEVNGVDYAGGIAGQSLGSSNKIKNCVNISTVQATKPTTGSGNREYYGQGYIIGHAEAPVGSGIEYNYYINSFDTSIENCGNFFDHGSTLGYNVMFTSDGHTSTADFAIILPSRRTSTPLTKETDIVELLNDYGTQLSTTAKQDFSPWTYDSNGLPKLCWEK